MLKIHFNLSICHAFKVKHLIEQQNPSLVATGRDLCSIGRGFNSKHGIRDGHYFTFTLKIRLFV